MSTFFSEVSNFLYFFRIASATPPAFANSLKDHEIISLSMATDKCRRCYYTYTEADFTDAKFVIYDPEFHQRRHFHHNLYLVLGGIHSEEMIKMK